VLTLTCSFGYNPVTTSGVTTCTAATAVAAGFSSYNYYSTLTGAPTTVT
jgi:hypothetical protein